MHNVIRPLCVIAWPLLMCGCQSFSTPATAPVVAQCLPPPPPAAWFMQPRARLDPAHAQRIIAITDDADNAVIALRACQAYVRAIVR